jgi:hypothetical protein
MSPGTRPGMTLMFDLDADGRTLKISLVKMTGD